MKDDQLKRRRGRPQGYLLSETTKNRIRLSRLGKTHSQATKDKISKSLSLYFKRLHPVSESFELDYRNFPVEVLEWLSKHHYDLDDSDDILPNKRLLYTSQLEIGCGSDIDNFCHYATPEFLLLLKEQLLTDCMDEELKEFNSIID